MPDTKLNVKSRLKRLTKAQLLEILYNVADDAFASRHIYHALNTIEQAKNGSYV